MNTTTTQATVPADPHAYNDAIEAALLDGRESHAAIDAAIRYHDAELARLMDAKGTQAVVITGERITVAQLAAQVGQSRHTTRKLLEAGAIPGARRKTPGLANSPWLIPADAPTLYLGTFATQTRTGRSH